MKLDDLDYKILSLLTKNARIAFRDLAEQCGVSRAAVHQHIVRMTEKGVITGSGFQVNPRDLSYYTCTYVGICLEKASMYKVVLPQLEAIPEIVECHYTTGPYGVLAKLYAIDNEDLMRILNEQIQNIEGVVSTETLISLSVGFSRPIPIPGIDTAKRTV